MQTLERELTLTEVAPARSVAPAKRERRQRLRQAVAAAIERVRPRTIPTQSVIMVVNGLSTMIRSGVSLVRSLEVLRDSETNPYLKEALRSVVADLENGHKISNAFGRQLASSETPLLAAMLATGERSGHIEDALEQFAAHLTRGNDLKQRVKSAMTYPLFMLATAVGLVVLFFRCLFPSFLALLTSLHTDLPLPTQILVVLNIVLTTPWVIALLIAAAAGFTTLGLRYLRTDEGRREHDRFLLALPVIGTVVRKVAMVNFSTTLSLLVDSGLAVNQSLRSAASTCGNVVIGEALHACASRMEEGQSLVESIEASDIFSADVRGMIMIGEQTGKLSDLLRRVSALLSTDVGLTLETATNLMEPLVVVCLGGMVGFIFVAIFLPVYQALNHLGV